jgi:hypothetical protein
MQTLQTAGGGAAHGPLPREALRAPRQRAKQGGTVPRHGRRDFAVWARAQPATLDGGFMRNRGCIATEAFYRPWRWVATAGGDHVGHPRFCCSAVAAGRGTVLAQRV